MLLYFSWADQTSVTMGAPVPQRLRGRHVHFGAPMQWIMPRAHFDDWLVRTLEMWTLQYVLLQPLICVTEIVVVSHHAKSEYQQNARILIKCMHACMHPSIYLSIHLSIHPSTYPPIHLSTYPPIRSSHLLKDELTNQRTH